MKKEKEKQSMIDLIEKIERTLENTKKLHKQTSEILPARNYYQGIIVAYKSVLKYLEDKNIITTPKSIKLSELIDKICETKYSYSSEHSNECCVKTIKINNGDYRIRVQYGGGGFWGDYDFYIVDGKISSNYDMDLPRDDFKWLYTLWIAETTIIDDLKEGK